LLVDPNFTDWYYSSNSQQLMLLGEMGRGKTVTMAYLVDELRRRSEQRIPQSKVCFYYCRDAGTGQAVQIVSCLILSLLEKLPGLKKEFHDRYKKAKASDVDPGTDIKKLGEIFQMLLEATDRPLFLLIDGLDECDRDSCRAVLHLLRIWTQKNSRLKVVLSSRPQEEILNRVDEMAKIYLPSDAKRDCIIVEKSVEMQLDYLSKDVKTLVIERLSHLTQGSAIWSKMVIELIKVGATRSLDLMELFLDALPLPGQLSELYRTLYVRCTQNYPENNASATTALKILAVTRRPLSILELTWAVALGTSRREFTTVAALGKAVDVERLMSLIYPFISRIDFSDRKKRQIQLVHQSVREFIMEEWTDQSCLRTPDSTTPDQVPSQQCVHGLEKFLLDICMRYLALNEIGTNKIFSATELAIQALPQSVDLFDEEVAQRAEYNPNVSWDVWEEDFIRFDPAKCGFGEFFIYASCHWVDHLGAVSVKPLPALSSLEELCRAGSTRLDNWIEQNRRPYCAIMPRFEFDSSLYDPLGITSLFGSAAMLRTMLEVSDLGKDTFLPNTMMEAASQILQWGDLSRLKILLESKHGHQLRNLAFFRLIIKRWSLSNAKHKDWDPAFDLVDSVLDELVWDEWGNTLLCVAAGAGCMPIVRRLMERAQDNAELKNRLTGGFLCDDPQ
jgi:hypothetical protein